MRADKQALNSCRDFSHANSMHVQHLQVQPEQQVMKSIANGRSIRWHTTSSLMQSSNPRLDAPPFRMFEVAGKSFGCATCEPSYINKHIRIFLFMSQCLCILRGIVSFLAEADPGTNRLREERPSPASCPSTEAQTKALKLNKQSPGHYKRGCSHDRHHPPHAGTP